jgi:TolB-like protein
VCRIASNPALSSDAVRPCSWSIAHGPILPFQDQSQDAVNAELADDFTRELIDVVARDPALVVKPWPDVAVYKGALAQPGEIARVLAVRYQLEGSLQLAEGRLRISAQLVDVQGRVLWSERFDESATERQALRDRIAAKIAAALQDSAEARDP